METCECGCRAVVKSGRTWVHGHNMRRPSAKVRMAAIGRSWRGKIGPESPGWRGTPEERLLRLLADPDEGGCRIYQGQLDRQGYGVLSIDNKNERAHRVAYRLWVGRLRESEVVHHRCETPSCCAPEHLVALRPGEHTVLHAALRREARAAA